MPDSTRFQTVLEVDFQSGTRYYSYRGVTSDTAFYKPKIESLGTVIRGISALPGKYRTSTFDIRLSNLDREFSILKASEPFHDLPVRMLRAETGGSLEVIARGKIAKWSLSSNAFSFTVYDPARQVLDQTIDRTLKILDSNTFPRLPVDQKPLLVPLPYGTLDSGMSVGPGLVPCYLIDPALDQSKYRYVCAQTAIEEVIRVFNYEDLVDPGDYTVTTASYGGALMTVIDFDADPRLTNRARDLEVTCDLSGRFNGSFWENPVQQAQDFHESFAPDGAPTLDTAGWTAAAADAGFRNYRGAFVLLDLKWTYQDVLDRFFQSFLMPSYVKRDGSLTCSVIFASVDVPTVTLSEVRHILNDSFHIVGNDPAQMATRVQYRTNFHWARGFFSSISSLFIPGEEAIVGREIVKDLELLFVRDVATASQVAKAHMPMLKENTQYVEAEIDPAMLEDTELNASMGVTHSQGIASTGLGYVNESMRLIQSDFRPNLKQSSVFIRGIISTAIVFEETIWNVSDLWALARPEQRVMQALLAPDDGLLFDDDLSQAIHIGGPEYYGGRGTLPR